MKIRLSRLVAATVLPLAGLGTMAAFATADGASAAHNPVQVDQTKIVNRYDGGGGGYWAYDSFGRTLQLQYLGKSGPAATPYAYTAMLVDGGSFRDIPGALTPNQGAPYTGKVLKPGQVTGSMNGYGQFAVFYTSAKAPRSDLVPAVLRGTTINANPTYASSTWPGLAFLRGTVISGLSETGFSYTYVVPAVAGTTTVHAQKAQKWVDSAWNGDGQLKGDGNITGGR